MKNPRDALEVIAAVLLGLVSVATALGAYQSAVWASQAADYALVSQQLRDRNLSESLTTQLIFRDDSGKVYDLLALDTGCVWGGCLSALRVEPGTADGAPWRTELLQVHCEQSQKPGE